MAFCGRSQGTHDKEKEMIADTSSLYSYNRDFLSRYTAVFELKSGNSAVLLVPAWQGRVMTSTAGGDNGFSFGWINHDLISGRKLQPHINAFGGEERLWLGPEGGQYSIFFPAKSDFTFENWQTPPFIDTEPYRITKSDDSSVVFEATATFENYSGTRFETLITRRVTILNDRMIESLTGTEPGTVSSVGYRSENKLTNEGDKGWTREKGLLSIWMLGMFNPSPSVIVAIPVKEGPEEVLGSRVNDSYFGAISGDRLRVKGNTIFFRADGKSRGKIGVPPLRANGAMGSYDSENRILTILLCTLPEGVKDYVNSAWVIQEKPYSGDAFNSYNDGPLDDGSQMGPFYELETSSPAAALQPGESITHNQTTLHFTGQPDKLNEISLKLLGISLEEIENAFN